MSSENNPSNEELTERMAQAVDECDSGILITFTKTEDEEGKEVLQPRVNMKAMNIGTILSADNIMHKVVHARVEYITLDYVRMLQEEEARNVPAENVSDPEDGGESGPPGAGPVV
jgi:hypothetical protein